MKSYKGKSLAWLKKECQKHFNQYIRLRDRDRCCISCGSPDTAHASHFFPVKMYDELRYDEDNCHASCVKCNTFLYGNIFYYSKYLPKKIGQERFDALVRRAEESKKKTHKWNRWELIEKIEYYKEKCRSGH